MSQQVTITSESPVSLKPLIEGAIRAELRMLELGIARTQRRLAEFEKQFGMSTADFERRFDGRDLQETIEFIEWSGEIKMLKLLEQKHQTLQGARVS